MDSQNKHTRDGAALIRLLPPIALTILLPVLVIAAGPDWWTSRGVINADPGVTAKDYAAVNQGQLKNMAKSAVAEFDAQLPGGAGEPLHNLVNGWVLTGSTTAKDYATVNLGQLKALSKPFYDRLITVGMANQYPWTSSTSPANDYAMANIGQVKYVFSFNPALFPQVSGPAMLTTYVGSPFSYAITASNSPTGYSASGLPAGLSLNGTTGLISGTTTTAGIYNGVFTVINASGTNNNAIVFNVLASATTGIPVINSSAAATASAGVPFAYQITASKNPTGFFAALSGTSVLPSGLNVDPFGGLISGTVASGTYTINLVATNAAGSGTAPLVLTVNPLIGGSATLPVITSTNTASGTAGGSFSFTLSGSNSPTGYGATGLPDGLTINGTTGVISGTSNVSGTFAIPVSIQNANGTTYGFLNVTINAPVPAITSALSVTTGTSMPFFYQITANNNPISFSSGTLPSGVSLNGTTGIISGTAHASGTFVIRAIDTSSGTASGTLALSVVSTPVITNSGTATATVGKSFSYNIVALNNPTGFGASGLPDGVVINPSTGLISGVPVIIGNSTITLSATNASGTATATVALDVTNNGPAVPVFYGATIFYTNQSGTIGTTIPVANGPAVLSASGLPAGLSINGTTGVISGNAPSTPGAYLANITGTNASGSSATQWLLVVKSGTSSITGTVQFQAGTSPLASYNTPTATIQSSTSDPQAANNGVVGLYAGNLNDSTEQRGLVEFDLSAMPSDATVTSGSVIVNVDTLPGMPVTNVDLLQTATRFYSANTCWALNSGTGSLLATASSPTPGVSEQILPINWVSSGSNGFAAITQSAFGSQLDLMIRVPAAEPPTSGTDFFYPMIPETSGTPAWRPSLTFVYTTSSPPVVLPNQTFSIASGDPVNYKIGILHNPGSIGATGTLPGGLSLDGSTGVFTGSLSSGTAFSSTFTLAISATNANGAGAGAVTAVVGQRPVFSGSLTFSGTANSYISFPITVTNGPVKFNASSLPPGLSIDPNTGLISGTVDEFYHGPTPFYITGSNDFGYTTIGGTLNIATLPPAFVHSLPSGTGYQYFPFSYTKTGTSVAHFPSGFNLSGSVPAGLSINSSGVISGTPTVAGTFDMVVSATNSSGTATAPWNLTIQPTPSFSVYSGTVVVYDYEIGYFSFNPLTWSGTLANGLAPSISGDLPGEFSFDDNGDVLIAEVIPTGTYTWTPTYTLGGTSVTGTIQFVVNPGPPIFQNNPLDTAYVGIYYDTSFYTDGADSVTQSGSLPSGLSFVDWGDQGELSGTPSAAGTYSVIVSSSNSSGVNTAPFLLNVVEPLQISNSGSYTGYIGSNVSYTIQTMANVGGRVFAITSGTLPANVSLNSSTGLISGTPASTGSSNVYNITFTASASGLNTGTGTLVLTILGQPAVTSPSLASGTVGLPFNYAITGSYNPTVFGATNLPSWATLDTTTGSLSGTPTAADYLQIGVSSSYLRSGTMVTGTAAVTLVIGASASDYSGTFQAGVYPNASFAVPACYIVNDGSAQADQVFNTGTVASGTGSITVGRVSGTSVDRGLLAFDLTSLPDNATITSARLILHSASVTGTFQTEIHEAGTPFDPQAATWNNNNAYNGSTLGYLVLTPASSGTNTFYGTTAFTQAVQQAHDGWGSIYLNLIAPAAESGSTAAYATFSSGTASPANNPELIVTYVTSGSSQAPVVTSPAIATGTAGSAFTYAVTASNLPTSFSASGLPSGLTLSSSNGVISGTVGTVSSTVAVVNAINSSGSGSKTITINIDSTQKATNLTIDSGNNQIGLIGSIATSPLVVRASGTSTPLANTLVTFSTNPGSGLLATSNTGSPVWSSMLSVPTGTDGKASVYMSLPKTPSTSLVIATAGTAAPVTFMETGVASTQGSGTGGSLTDLQSDVPILSVVSGQNQVGGTNAVLPVPIVIQAANHLGLPSGTLPLVFTVTGSSCSISASGTGTFGNTLSISTGSDGRASVYLKTGTADLAFDKVSGSTASSYQGVHPAVMFSAFTQNAGDVDLTGSVGGGLVAPINTGTEPTPAKVLTITNIAPYDYVKASGTTLGTVDPSTIYITYAWSGTTTPLGVTGYLVERWVSGTSKSGTTQTGTAQSGSWQNADALIVTSENAAEVFGLYAETDYEFRVVPLSGTNRLQPTPQQSYGFPLVKAISIINPVTSGTNWSDWQSTPAAGSWGHLWLPMSKSFLINSGVPREPLPSGSYKFILNPQNPKGPYTIYPNALIGSTPVEVVNNSPIDIQTGSESSAYQFDLNKLVSATGSNYAGYVFLNPKIEAVGTDGTRGDQPYLPKVNILGSGTDAAGSFSVVWDGSGVTYKAKIVYSSDFFQIYDSSGRLIASGSQIQTNTNYEVVALPGTPDGTIFDVTVQVVDDKGNAVYGGDIAEFVYKPSDDPKSSDYSLPIDESSGPKYRKIGMNGLPLADEKPQHTDETDQEKEETFVDALTLGLRHSTTDVYMPVAGSDFAVSARRDVASQVWSERHGLRPNEEPDKPFGVCWTTNLAANVHFTKSDNPGQTEPDSATVVDEGGGVHTFVAWYGTYDTAHEHPIFFPKPTARNEQTPNLDSLVRNDQVSPAIYTFKRKYGAILTFETTAQTSTIPEDRTLGSNYHLKNTYARLTQAVDRLGNVVNYQYRGTYTLVPAIISVANQPDTRLYIAQDSNGHITSIWDAKGNQTQFHYTSYTEPSYRDGNPSAVYYLDKVTTADGAETHYTYDFYDSEVDATPHASDDPGNIYRHVDLATIKDPLNNQYSFDYTIDASKLNYMANPKLYTGYYRQSGLPRNITKVTAPDSSHADFKNDSTVWVEYVGGKPVQRGQRVTEVTDATQKCRRVYQFGDPLVIPIPNLAKYYNPNSFTDSKMICYQSLSLDYIDLDTLTKLGGEKFTFDVGATMALSQITDFSGNTTTFAHGDPWTVTDDYLSIIGSGSYSTLLGMQSFNGHYGDPTTQTNALGNTKTFAYTAASRIMTDVTDEEGRHTHYDVDALERRTKATVYPSGTINPVQITDFEYGDPVHPGFMTKKTVEALGGGDPAWAVPLVTQYISDADGRVAQEIVDPSVLHLVTSYTYDVNGNKLTATDPRGYTTWFSYDSRNRLITVTYADGTQKQFVYDARGNKTAEYDENNIATLYHYDTLNRVDQQARDMNGNGVINSGTDLITSYVYNNVGSKTSVTNPNGNTTLMAYDNMQRIKSTTDALSHTTTLEYGNNSGGNAFDISSFKPTKSTDPRGIVTNVTYDALYRPMVKSIVYDSYSPPAATSTVYDKVGNPTGMTDPLGHQTMITYDALNRPTRNTNADNTYNQTFYTSTGLKWRIRDELWDSGTPYAHTTETEYDGAGRVVSVIGSQVDNGHGHQRRPITRTRYDAAGNVAATINPLCQEVDFAYDARNRKVQEFDPAVADAEHSGVTTRPVKTLVYDAAGRTIAAVDPRGNEIDTTYDAANRPIQVQMPAAPYLSGTASGTSRPTTSTTYDANGNVLAVTDPNSHVTTNHYDALNRLTSTVDAASITVSYEYDQVGNRTKVTDGNGNITVLTYDGLNRNTTSTDAGGNTTTFKYDGMNKVQRIDAMRQVTSYLYDARNRLQSVVYVSGNTSVNSQRNYSYDAVGNLLSVSEPGKSGAADTAYTYDALNRAITETSSGVTHNYTLDLLGNRLETLYGGPSARTIVSTYDALNRLSSMSESSGTATPRVSGYAYDLNSNVQTKTLPNGDTETGSFDALNRMHLQIATGTTSGTLFNYIYQYDLTGNVTSVGETYATSGTLHASARTVTNTYDAINRLQVEGDSLSGTTSYTYDNGNNRTKKVIGSGTTTYTYNTLNQLVAYNDIAAGVGTALTYDANGNRVTRVVSGGTNSGTDAYSYDFENRLVGLVKGSGGAGVVTGTYAYGYDYRTRRILRDESRIASGTSTRVVFSGGLSVQEIDSGTTPTVEYIRGSDYGGGVGGVLYTLRSGTPSYTHENKRGDVVAKTDGDGSLTYQAVYQAYGTRTQEVGSTTDRQKANTKDEDPTGLLDEGFRYRDLETGIFITADPAGFVDGPNMYTYVRQNPWTSFDSEGFESENERKAEAKRDLKIADQQDAIAKRERYLAEHTYHNSLSPESESEYNKHLESAESAKAIAEEARRQARILSLSKNDFLWKAIAEYGGINNIDRQTIAYYQEKFDDKLGMAMSAGLSSTDWIEPFGKHIWLPAMGALVGLGEAPAFGAPTMASNGAIIDIGEGLTINSPEGGVSLPMSIVRTVGSDGLTPEIVNEIKSLTYETGNEHALVTLKTGENAVVSGGPGGINFQEGEITYIHGHAHPYENISGGFPSGNDKLSLEKLNQERSVIYWRGMVIHFDKNGSL